MDSIDRAMEKGLHRSGTEEFDSQTWEDFEQFIQGKKVFLFGVGTGANCYFDRYKDRAVLDGVIDNDSRKLGLPVGVFLAGTYGLEQSKVMVSASSILDGIAKEDAVVLIASTNYYKEIAEQLKQMGIRNCFILLIMEANRRQMGGQDKTQETISEKEEFALECLRQMPIEEKKIFFRAYGDYADHGKYITEALLKIRTDLDLVWVVSDMTAKVPKGVRKIYGGNWKQFIYEMETAKVWILDLAVPSFITKRQGQLYIQTKHWASITLKKFYLDTVTFRGISDQIENWKRDGQMIDYIITGSEFDEESCRRGFGFQKEILPFGSPRSDALFHEEENKEKVYRHYGLDLNTHTILYAPTYRFDKNKGKKFHVVKEVELEFERIKQAAEQKFGGEWFFLLRLHPSVARVSKEIPKPEFVIDASDYADSEELVSAADITISDFSSIMFEPAFVKKPVFLFTTDLNDYIEKEYELLIPYYDLPFPVAESNEELEQRIREFDRRKYHEILKNFFMKYGVEEDGHASERTARFLAEYLG